MAQWFYKAGSKSIGPVDEKVMRDWARQGAIHPSTLVRRDETEPWRRADECAGDLMIVPARTQADVSSHGEEQDGVRSSAKEPERRGTLFALVPKPARTALNLLLLIGTLKCIPAVICTLLLVSDRRKPANPGFLICLAVMWALALLPVSALTLLYYRVRLGKALALVVGCIWLLGFPFLTIAGVAMLSALVSPEMSEYLSRKEIAADAA